MNKKSNTYRGVIFIALLLSIISGILIYSQSGKDNDYRQVEYSSIYEMLSKTSLDITIPSSLVEVDEEIHCNENSGLVTVYSNTFVLKVSSFVDIGADPLGLYEESLVTKEYNVVNSDINYIRYRQQYSEYPNSTIVNWYTDNTCYGFMIEKDMSEDDIFNMLEIDLSNIEYNEVEKETDSTNLVKYQITDNISISLPEFKSDTKYIDMSGSTVFFIDNTMILSVVYNDYDILAETYKGQESILINDNLQLNYLNENPFDPNSLAYDDYELFISTIDYIKESIVYN